MELFLVIHLIESKGFAETVNNFSLLSIGCGHITVRRESARHRWLQRLKDFRDGRLDF